MSDQTFLTKEGLKKLEEELNFLRTVRRGQVAERLHNAQEDGELIENAEYEDAKNEQAFLEGLYCFSRRSCGRQFHGNDRRAAFT